MMEVEELKRYSMEIEAESSEEAVELAYEKFLEANPTERDSKWHYNDDIEIYTAFKSR